MVHLCSFHVSLTYLNVVRLLHISCVVSVVYCVCVDVYYKFVFTWLCVAASKISGSLKLTDAQKKLVEEDAGQTLAQQENMQISGSQARQMVMQKLLRANEVS